MVLVAFFSLSLPPPKVLMNFFKETPAPWAGSTGPPPPHPSSFMRIPHPECSRDSIRATSNSFFSEPLFSAPARFFFHLRPIRGLITGIHVVISSRSSFLSFRGWGARAIHSLYALFPCKFHRHVAQLLTPPPPILPLPPLIHPTRSLYVRRFHPPPPHAPETFPCFMLLHWSIKSWKVSRAFLQASCRANFFGNFLPPFPPHRFFFFLDKMAPGQNYLLMPLSLLHLTHSFLPPCPSFVTCREAFPLITSSCRHVP